MILVRIDRIKGDVRIEGYKDWFIADSIDFGVGRKVEVVDTSGKDIEEGKVEEQELSISKSVDVASVYLMHAAMKGRTEVASSRPVSVDIHLAQIMQSNASSSRSVQAYLKIRIENAIITNWDIEASGDERPSESIKLWFNRAAMKYRASADGKVFETHGPLGWDQQENKDWKPDVLLKNDD